MSVSSEIIPSFLQSRKWQTTLDQKKHSILFQEKYFV